MTWSCGRAWCMRSGCPEAPMTRFGGGNHGYALLKVEWWREWCFSLCISGGRLLLRLGHHGDGSEFVADGRVLTKRFSQLACASDDYACGCRPPPWWASSCSTPIPCSLGWKHGLGLLDRWWWGLSSAISLETSFARPSPLSCCVPPLRSPIAPRLWAEAQVRVWLELHFLLVIVYRRCSFNKTISTCSMVSPRSPSTFNGRSSWF
jgi:hypothetical protein